MRKSVFLLGILFFCGLYSSSIAVEVSDSPLQTEAVVVDHALARHCLAQAKKRKEAADFFIGVRLNTLEREDIERLAALIRMELGAKAVADAAVVPPRGDLSAAWLLNRLSAESETLAFDMAIDGFFVRRIGSGKRYRFRPFGEKEMIVVRTDAATLGHGFHERNMQGASRLYLRKIPDSKEYYVIAWSWLIKQRNSPPAPNPEGRYVQGLMNQRTPRQ